MFIYCHKIRNLHVMKWRIVRIHHINIREKIFIPWVPGTEVFCHHLSTKLKSIRPSSQLKRTGGNVPKVCKRRNFVLISYI